VPGQYSYAINAPNGTALSTVFPELVFASNTALQVNNNSLIATSAWAGAARLSGGVNVSNNQMVEFKVLGTLNGDIQMRLRDSGTGDLYVAFIYSNRVVFSKFQSYNQTVIGSTISTAVASGDRLQFRIVGSTLSFVRNGTELTSFTDVTLMTGRPGFAIDGTTVGLDDLVIGSYGSGAPAPGPAPAPTPSVAGRYSYSFNVASGTALASYAPELDFSRGSGLFVSNSALASNTSWAGDARLANGSNVSANQAVEFKVIGTANGELAIKLRDNGAGNCYYAFIYANRVQLYKNQGYNLTTLGPTINANIPSGAKVQFRVVGNQLTFAVNGVDIGSVSDASFTTGLPAFSLDGPTVGIDDLVIGSYSTTPATFAKSSLETNFLSQAKITVITPLMASASLPIFMGRK
jgi:hypothetical protein